MGQQDTQDDEHLETFETEPIIGSALSPWLNAKTRNPSRFCLLAKCSIHRAVGRCNESDLSDTASICVQGPQFSVITMVVRKMPVLGQKPGERMRTEAGLKLKGGWKWVKFPEARGGEPCNTWRKVP